MNKMTRFLIVTTIAMSVIIASCGTGNTATPVILPTNTQVKEVQPEKTSPSLPPTQVPECPNNPDCAPLVYPTSQPADTYCVKKIPYQNFVLPPGAEMVSLEPAHPEFKCNDSKTVIEKDDPYKGIHKGDHIWTCTGNQLWAYQVRVTNPACQPRDLVVDASKCAVGMQYDKNQQCCTASTQKEGLADITINLGACP